MTKQVLRIRLTIQVASVIIGNMLKIRLQRVGRKHEPLFRLVLTDSKNSTKSGKFLEILGNYDSRRGEQAVFDAPRIVHWIGVGAQPSETVHNLLVSRKIIEGKKINVLPKKKPIIDEKAVAAAEAAKAAPVAEEPVSDEIAVESAEHTPVEPETPTEVATEETPAVA